MPWLKLGIDAIDDRKLNGPGMTDTDRWLWICLLMVAREYGGDGIIPVSPDEVAWRLRRTPQTLERSLNKYIEAGMVTMTDEGDILIINFAKRQKREYPSDSNERVAARVARYRERRAAMANVTSELPLHQDVTNVTSDVTNVTNLGENVTNCNEDVTRNVTSPIKNIELRVKNKRNLNQEELVKPASRQKSTSRTKARASLVDDPFEITDSILAWAQGKGYDVDRDDLASIAESFVNHHKAKGTRYIDWEAAFKNWVNRDIGLGWGNPRGGASTGNGHGPRHASKRADFGSPYGGTIEIGGDL